METREELGATLDEIEFRLTPKNLVNQATSWVSRSYDRNPSRWLMGIGVVLVGSVAAVLWAVFSRED
jgi:hypothetical protein